MAGPTDQQHGLQSRLLFSPAADVVVDAADPHCAGTSQPHRIGAQGHGQVVHLFEPVAPRPPYFRRQGNGSGAFLQQCGGSKFFIDLAKITKEVPFEELKKNVTPPVGGICYAQCPMIYWSFKGKTIAEKSLPVLVYEKTVVSARYESGGRHGIERVDEFHRIEPVYIGTREQLLSLKDKLIQRYKHVFNDIFDLEWRMAWVTPWYMQQAGEIDSEDTHPRDTGTIDFEAYLPYRGSREKGEWLEFQNLSILGDKYVKAFNIKAQKSMLWSGCSGIGLERWVVVFLAQKGLNPDKWPEGFRKYLDKIPEGIEFL